MYKFCSDVHRFKNVCIIIILESMFIRGGPFDTWGGGAMVFPS